MGLSVGAALVAPACFGCRSHSVQSVKSPKVVALAPFNGIDAKSVETARRALEEITKAKVVVLEPEALPPHTYYRPRSRYRADRLIEHLAKRPYWHVIGLTHRDVSTTKGPHYDWGVFGLGYCPGKSCVVSTFRLKGRKDRLAKVVQHEFGHTLGLPHCTTPSCLMNDAKGKAATVDAANAFCQRCKLVIEPKDI